MTRYNLASALQKGCLDDSGQELSFAAVAGAGWLLSFVLGPAADFAAAAPATTDEAVVRADSPRGRRRLRPRR